VRPEPGAKPAVAGLRTSRADRERVIDLLKAAFVEDRLTRDEFDERVGRVLASRTYPELAAVTADLPGPIAAPPSRPPAQAQRRIGMSTAINTGAAVVVAATVGMTAALLAGSGAAVVTVALLAVFGMIAAIVAMVVAP
jgi:Domain of unknown function (DUF1707)